MTGARRGPPSLPEDERRARAKARDRAKKAMLRAGMVQRTMIMTPEQSERLERARPRGGFRTTADLVRALIAGAPEEVSS